MRFDNPLDFRYHGTSATSPYNGTKDLFSRYALSKLANILFTTALQQRYQNIFCASCNPGGTNTAGGMSVWPVFLRPIMSRLFVAPAVGALPVLLLASGREGYKGVYMGNKCKVEKPSEFASNPDLAENLWILSENALTKWLKA
jgi:NAD(P)-dependent dehydrogenase (short-subunit alcohol dehydrogenase family)